MTDCERSTQLITEASRERDIRELRPLSILFCDVVDSVGLSTRLLDEDYQDVIKRFRAICRQLTEKAGGHVVQEIGDGILVCFGCLTTREDDAERAVQVALDMTREVGTLSPGEGSTIEVRTGVASGAVPIGDPEVVVDGVTTNLAARLTETAEPGSVVTEERTYQLTRALFAWTDLGRRSLKGFEEPMQLWRVDRAHAVTTRFDVRVRLGLTPFVGREEQLSTLLGRWENACSGRGQVVLLSGEPGIGKSRIIQVILERIKIPEQQLLRLQCLPDHENTALHPIIDQLKRTLDVVHDDPVNVKINKLESFVESRTKDVSELAPVYAGLLSMPESHFGRIERNPEKLRKQTAAVLLEYLTGRANQDNCILVVEDVHWVDPTTKALLDTVIDKARQLRLMVLVSFRHGELQIPWVEAEHVTALKLEPLDDPYQSLLIHGLTIDRPLLPEQHDSIVSRCGGVPLFLEELTKSALETGAVDVMPSQLESLLLSRLDPLGKIQVSGLDVARSVKEVAQICAVVGWEFSIELLKKVMAPNVDTSSDSEVTREIEAAIERLLESGLISKRGDAYHFKHVLIQEEAYRSLLRKNRAQLHARIARILKETPDRFDIAPEFLAYHFYQAGLTTDAIEHWQAAGHRTARRSSNLEAEHHFRRAMDALGTLPKTVNNLSYMLQLHNDLGPVLMASKGFAASAVEQLYERAVRLGARIGRAAELYFPALAGLQLVRLVQGRHREACQLGEECLAIALETGDSVYLVEAYRHRGAARFWMGDIAESREDFEQVLKHYEPERHEELKFIYGTDPKVSALVFLSMVASLVGRRRDAAARGREAIELVQNVSHRHTEVYANLALALAHDLRGEGYEARARARDAMRIGSEVPFWSSWAKIVKGRTLLQEGRFSEVSPGQMEEDIEAYRKTGAGLAETYFMMTLADSYEARGNVEKALDTLEDGLILTERGGEHFYEAELLRRKGEMLLLTGTADTDVERCLQAALKISNRQGTRLFELRAAVSLDRLWRGQTRQAETQSRIEAILNEIDADDESQDVLKARRTLERSS